MLFSYAREASKANAIRQLKDMFSCDRVIAFGDGKTDIDMFEIADEGYAVSNAHEALKKKSLACPLASLPVRSLHMHISITISDSYRSSFAVQRFSSPSTTVLRTALIWRITGISGTEGSLTE